MRCKKHLSDHSSSVGVCASCLRERLTAAQAQALIQPSHTRVTSEDRRKQPSPVFPRSVSPYVSRRKSPSTWAHPHRFYSTPQVGPTYDGASTLSTAGGKKRRGKFSLISNLFRSRSDPRVDCRDSSSSPSSWFLSTIFPSRRKKKSMLFYADDSTANGRICCRISNPGMSPARETESDEDFDRSPMAAVPAVRGTRTTSHGKNVSGLAFCLSPLVRASPSQHWNQRGPEFLYSGEVRSTMKPHLSTAASFCANRSRKLADFGRVNHNR